MTEELSSVGGHAVPGWLDELRDIVSLGDLAEHARLSHLVPELGSGPVFARIVR
jgi:hypothetical protein